jgi:hypothetical protein
VHEGQAGNNNGREERKKGRERSRYPESRDEIARLESRCWTFRREIKDSCGTHRETAARNSFGARIIQRGINLSRIITMIKRSGTRERNFLPAPRQRSLNVVINDNQ